MRWLLLISLVWSSPLLAAGVLDRNVEDQVWTDEYDGLFRKHSKRYFGPYFDWRWFKAQGIAESNLNPEAESHVGAKGIMQILPSTFEEIRDNNPHLLSIEDPRWNIAAGIWYDRQLYRKWRKPLPSEERLYLAFSSYNAGYGGVLKAIKRSRKKPYNWQQVQPHLPRETRGYVARISALMEADSRQKRSLLKFLLGDDQGV